jgi:hypothetical protein
MAAVKSIVVKWSGKEYPVELPEQDTVASLKRALQQHTQVDPKRQKLLGLKTKDGKAATDEAVLADLLIKPNTKVMMMGQPEEVIAKAEAEQLAAPEVQVGGVHATINSARCDHVLPCMLACAQRRHSYNHQQPMRHACMHTVCRVLCRTTLT